MPGDRARAGVWCCILGPVPARLDLMIEQHRPDSAYHAKRKTTIDDRRVVRPMALLAPAPGTADVARVTEEGERETIRMIDEANEHVHLGP